VIQTGFSQRTTLTPSLDNGLTYKSTLANPFPDGITEPTGASLGAMTYAGSAITFFNTTPKTPYQQRWQLGLQRDFGGRMAGTIGYVGNRGTHLETNRDLNAIPVQYLSRLPVRDQATINYLGANLTNPYYPLLPGTSRQTTTIARVTLLTAFPQFTSAAGTSNEGFSWFHSLQARLEKRFSTGLTVQSAYSFSKFMEATTFLNAGDPWPARAVSDMDFPHRLSLSWIWELPVGRGRRWGSGLKGVPGGIVGGWQLGAIFAVQSGQALTFGNVIFAGNVKDIPLDSARRSMARWFNIDAGFDRVSTRQLSYNLRNFPLRLSGVRSDGIWNWDLSAIKKTRVREGMHLQFRAEFLNAFNHPLFMGPDMTVTSTTFGVVTALKNHPRRIQLAMKLVF
jgi:hypothetical protein